jgi:hypothetical protein
MPLQRDQPRAREKPRTALSVCQKVIVEKRKNIAANFPQVLLMLQCSASKLMTTLMVTGAGRTRNLQDQRNDFGAGVVLLDLPRERTWKMGPIKRKQEFDPIFFQETFRFSQGEFTEILSNIRDLDGDLSVDGNGDPGLSRHLPIFIPTSHGNGDPRHTTAVMLGGKGAHVSLHGQPHPSCNPGEVQR